MKKQLETNEIGRHEKSEEKHNRRSQQLLAAWYIRLGLGKLLVSLLQVVKRINTPPIPQQMASSAGP